MLHEAIHANIQAYLYGSFDLAYEDPEKVRKLKYLYDYYETGYGDSSNFPDHHFMVEYFIDPIKQALWEFNDFQGDINDYEYFAWEGLPEEHYFSVDEFNLIKDRALSNVNQNLNQCD